MKSSPRRRGDAENSHSQCGPSDWTERADERSVGSNLERPLGASASLFGRSQPDPKPRSCRGPKSSHFLGLRLRRIPTAEKSPTKTAQLPSKARSRSSGGAKIAQPTDG